jgi:8-oxo-dGTP diphosphatase
MQCRFIVNGCFEVRRMLMPPMSPIPVVCALIEDGAGRVLVARRPAGKHLALKWEFPGGKVEPGETDWEALVREIREELGAAIVPLPGASTLPRCRLKRTSGAIELIPSIVRLAAGSPDPVAREHLELRWVHPAALVALDLAPADRILARRWSQWRQDAPGGGQ